MGTVGSYTGGGGKPGKELREDVESWLDQVSNDPSDDSAPAPSTPKLDPESLLNVVQLLRPRTDSGGGGDGPGGGGAGGSIPGTGRRTGGGPMRTAAASAGSAGRAAAAAYALRTGNAAELQRLGLDYNELRGLSVYKAAQKIVDAACGPRTDSSIEEHEQRLVAAELAEWVLATEKDGVTPSPEEITRQAIAMILAETALVETGALSAEHQNGALAESEIRDIAEALAARAELSVDGATQDEFSSAIESGLDTLRKVQRSSDG